MRKCPKCGAEHEDAFLTCIKCETSLVPKPKIPIGIFILGGIGFLQWGFFLITTVLGGNLSLGISHVIAYIFLTFIYLLLLLRRAWARVALVVINSFFSIVFTIIFFSGLLQRISNNNQILGILYKSFLGIFIIYNIIFVWYFTRPKVKDQFN